MKYLFGKRKSKNSRDLGEAMNASSSSSTRFVTQDSPFVTERHRDGPTMHWIRDSLAQKDLDFSSSFSSVEDLTKSDSHSKEIKKPRSAILITHPSSKLVLDMELPSPPRLYSSRKIQVAVLGNGHTRSNERESARPMLVRSASASNFLDNHSSRCKKESRTKLAMIPRSSSSDQILDQAKGSRNRSCTKRRSKNDRATDHVRESNRRNHCNISHTKQDSDSSVEGGLASAPRPCLPYLRSKSERMLIADGRAAEYHRQDGGILQQPASFRTQHRNSVTKFNLGDLSPLLMEGEDEYENLRKSINLLSATKTHSQLTVSVSSSNDESNPKSRSPSNRKYSDKRPPRSEPSRSQRRHQQKMTRPKSFSGLDRRNSVTEFNLSSSQEDLFNIRIEAADRSRSNRMRGQLAQDLWNDVSDAAGRRSPSSLTASLNKKSDRVTNVCRSDSAEQIEHFQCGNDSSTLARSGRRIQKARQSAIPGNKWFHDQKRSQQQ